LAWIGWSDLDWPKMEMMGGRMTFFFHICIPYIYIITTIYIYISHNVFPIEWPSTAFFYGGDSDKLHGGPIFGQFCIGSGSTWLRSKIVWSTSFGDRKLKAGISWDIVGFRDPWKWREMTDTLTLCFELNLEMVDVRNVWMRLCIYHIYI
jgi:hypothetical protein